jgi:hypothetical protein
MNENKPVKVSRDGQELLPEIGYKLCKILDTGNDYDITVMDELIGKIKQGESWKQQTPNSLKFKKNTTNTNTKMNIIGGMNADEEEAEKKELKRKMHHIINKVGSHHTYSIVYEQFYVL